MTNPTAARIARGYDEATAYDADHPGPLVISGDTIYVRADRILGGRGEIVNVPRKYGMSEVPRWAQPTPTWDEAVSSANDDDKLWRDAAIATPKVPMEALYEAERMRLPAENDNATLDDLIGKAVYVATPYTKYAHGHAAAAYDAAEVAARLIDYGLSPLSPIAHSHAVATVGRLDKVDGELWQRVDAPWVRVAEACVVVKMPGWEESAGVQHEIAAFRAAGKPVVFMDWGMG